MTNIISDIVAEITKELDEDAVKVARAKIKDKQKQIRSSKTILKNLEREYDDLLATLNEELGG